MSKSASVASAPQPAQRKAKSVDASPAKKAQDRAEADAAERRLGRSVAIALPSISFVAAIAVGVVASMGPAILILVSGALLGTIAFFWASVRTLSGDAPLPEDLEGLAARHDEVDAVAEKKRTVLRALKDLEHEHAIGKIDANDYAELSAQYREQAKELMREMDAELEPQRERAEEIAKEYLASKGWLGDVPPPPPAAAPAEDAPARLACPSCSTTNDPDAAFCKKCGKTLSPEKSPDASA